MRVHKRLSLIRTMKKYALITLIAIITVISNHPITKCVRVFTVLLRESEPNSCILLGFYHYIMMFTSKCSLFFRIKRNLDILFLDIYCRDFFFDPKHICTNFLQFMRRNDISIDQFILFFESLII